MSDSIDRTKLSHILKVLKSVEKNTIETDPYVTFEFLCASCYPSIWRNVQEKMVEEYKKGFEDGSKNLNYEENFDIIN